jgi:hypothetical protein
VSRFNFFFSFFLTLNVFAICCKILNICFLNLLLNDMEYYLLIYKNLFYWHVICRYFEFNSFLRTIISPVGKSIGLFLLFAFVVFYYETGV